MNTHTCCYCDFIYRKSAIIEGYVLKTNLVVTYYNDTLGTNISRLTDEITSKKNSSYYINTNEPLELSLGERKTISIPFDPSNEDVILAYKSAYESLREDERILFYDDVEMTETSLTSSVFAILLYSFSKELFSNKGVRTAQRPGGEIDNPFPQFNTQDNYVKSQQKLIESLKVW
jgi:hypothetical protein